MNAPQQSKTPSQIIDAYAELKQFLDPYLDQLKALEKEVSEMVKSAEDPGPLTLIGARHCIDYSAVGLKTVCTVSPQQFIKATKAWDAVTVSITQAKKLLTPDLLQQLFTDESGSRRFLRIRPLPVPQPSVVAQSPVPL